MAGNGAAGNCVRRSGRRADLCVVRTMSGCPVMSDVDRHLAQVDRDEALSEALSEAVADRMREEGHSGSMAADALKRAVLGPRGVAFDEAGEDLANLAERLKLHDVVHADLDPHELLLLWIACGDEKAGSEIQQRAAALYWRSMDALEADFERQEIDKFMRRFDDC